METREQQAQPGVLPAAQAVEVYGPVVLRVAYGMVKNWADAEDVAQETFLSLVRAAPVFASAEHQKAWLLRTAINHCKSHFRSAWQRRTQGLDENLPAPFTPQESALLEAVAALPEKYRAVICLFYLEGYSTAELAQILQANQNTVLSRLHRARRLLRDRLKGEWEV